MKTNKFLTFLSVLTLTLFITSCVEDDDYEIPEVQEREEKIERRVPRKREEPLEEEPLKEEDIEIIDPFKED